MTGTNEDPGRFLLWSGVIMLIVGMKLLLSYVVPGLKSPGELLLSGGLLTLYSIRAFRFHSRLKRLA